MTNESNHQRFDRWLIEHRGLMLKVAFSFSSDRSDQEDLLQEIAVALWKSLNQFRSESKESTWVYKVALFTATAWSRSELRRKKNTEVLQAKNIIHEQVLSEDPRQEWLLETVREFPLLDRTLILSCLEGYTQAEIAEMTGISTTNVGVRLHRLKKRLVQLATEQTDDI